MTITMLECFMEAMETLNFTIAAQNMHITQPAFSRNIAALENKLGFALFVRSKQNGLSATPAGEEFYHGIQNLGAQFDTLLQRTSRISRGEEGKLAVGIINGMCVDSYTKLAIQTLMERHPQLEVQLMCYPFRELIQSVEEGKIDTCLVINHAVKNKENLRYVNIVEVQNYLAIPARLHCNVDEEHSLKEFENETFLLSEDAPELNELLLNSCRIAGFEPQTRMAPDFETKMLWAEFGQGCAVHSNEHYIKNSAHVNFIKVKEIGVDSYAMIWQKDNNNPAIPMFGSMFNNIMHR